MAKKLKTKDKQKLIANKSETSIKEIILNSQEGPVGDISIQNQQRTIDKISTKSKDFLHLQASHYSLGSAFIPGMTPKASNLEIKQFIEKDMY